MQANNRSGCRFDTSGWSRCKKEVPFQQSRCFLSHNNHFSVFFNPFKYVFHVIANESYDAAWCSVCRAWNNASETETVALFNAFSIDFYSSAAYWRRFHFCAVWLLKWPIIIDICGNVVRLPSCCCVVNGANTVCNWFDRPACRVGLLKRLHCLLAP